MGIAGAALVLWLIPDREKRARFRSPDWILAGVLLLLALLQLTPLPLPVVRLLAPHRAAQVDAVAAVTGPVGSATLSSVPAATRDAVLTLATYLLVFFVSGDLVRRVRKPWLMAAPLIAVAALEAGLGVVQAAGGTEAVGTYVNRNHFAGLLEMCLPFAILYGFRVLFHRRTRNIGLETGVVACLFFGAACMILVAVVDSRSRMGFLSTLAGVFVCAVIGLWNRARNSHRRGSLFLNFWLPIAGAGAVLALAFVFLASDQMIGRLSEFDAPSAPVENTRERLWKESLPLVADYKMTGCGLGAYESCFLPYKAVAPNYIADRAHNDYIQLMAELGLPGFVCILALAVLAWWTAVREGASHSSGRYLAIACAGSLTAILLHSLADFNLYVPANGMLAAWVAGLARRA